MSTIFKVLGKIRHNQDEFEAGQLIEIEAFGEGSDESIADLLRAGAMEEVAGASTVEEAEKIIADQAAAAAEASEVIAEAAPRDTWGPQPDPVEEVAKDETVVTPPADGTVTTDTENATPASTEAVIDNPADRGAVNEGQTPAAPEDTGDNL